MARKRKDSFVQVVEVPQVYELSDVSEYEECDFCCVPQHDLSLTVASDQTSVFWKLDRTIDEIRLFKLQPGRFHDPICGTFETFPVDACPKFRALSYEWFRKRPPTEDVYVGQDVIKIRFNLWLFIKNYRANMDLNGDENIEYLWIDNVCVNQKNVHERNHQVHLMHDIYWKAHEVVAWLGLDYEQCKYYRKHPPKEWDCPILQKCIQVDGPDMFKSSFWDRLWVQQELVLAHKVVFLVGRVAISAERAKERFGADLSLAMREPALWASLSSKDREKWICSLVDAIKMFSTKRCHDRRDRVYGLLGMVWPYQRITVDYNLSTYQVFQATVRKVFEQEFLPVAKFREVYVVKTLVRLGGYMGLSHDEAFQECQDV